MGPAPLPGGDPMSSEYIDKAYVDNALGKDVVSGMTGAATSATSSTILTQLIQSASSMVEGALRNAGYTPPGGVASAPALVKTATLGALLPLMYGRKQVEMPTEYQMFVEAFSMLRNGEAPTTLPLEARDAVGGTKWTDHSSRTDGRPRVFGGLRDLY